MEQCNNDTRKRARDDSVEHSPDSKRVIRVDSDSNANSGESFLDSSGVNEIQDDLYNIFDDADTTVQGLDSFIKSFEDEILADPGQDPNPTPESSEFIPNLGYLLEASDDELGLPPTVAPSEEQEKLEIADSGRVGPEGVDMSGFCWFEEDIRNYEGFGFVGYDADENGDGYVTIDGLFDHAEPAWRSESLQAM